MLAIVAAWYFSSVWFFRVPAWAFIAGIFILCAVPLVAFTIKDMRKYRRELRVMQGLCPRCGYDLHMTPLQCPECGMQQVGGIGADISEGRPAIRGPDEREIKAFPVAGDSPQKEGVDDSV
jgi:hypothetical protein